jgi:hypothetical protein
MIHGATSMDKVIVVGATEENAKLFSKQIPGSIPTTFDNILDRASQDKCPIVIDNWAFIKLLQDILFDIRKNYIRKNKIRVLLKGE